MRKHHLVPRFYLARFADKGERLRVVNRETGERLIMRAKNAARQSGFYTIELEDGLPSEVVEDALSRLEADAARAMVRTFDEGGFPPTPEDREVLATFLALQLVRGSDHREAQNLIADYVAKIEYAGMTESRLRAMMREAGHDMTDEEVAEHVTFLRDTDGYRVEPTTSSHVQSMIEAAEDLFPIFLRRSWVLFEFDEPCLLTSDVPIAMYKSPEKGQQWLGVGLLNADEVWFPVDRQRLLILVQPPELEPFNSDVAERHLRHLPLAQAAGVNYLVAAQAHRWYFHHADDEPLAGQALPATGPRIQISGPGPKEIGSAFPR